MGVLTLAAEPASVPSARHFVRTSLTGQLPSLVDAAEACISELVTNAVLHARTQVEIRLEDLGERVRLEVRDGSAVLPRRLVHTVRSSTGRGMELVSFLADAWGVVMLEGAAKAVWCELVIQATGTADRLDADPVLAAWSDDADPLVPSWTDEEDPVVSEPLRTAQIVSRTADQRVASPGFVLLGYPVRMGIRARDHNSAILRECALLMQAGSATSAPDRLVELAEQITGAYAGELAAVDEQRTEAYFAGLATVDVRYPAVPDAARIVGAWQSVMDELDAFAAGSALLSLATPPDLAELRTWTVGEFLGQSAGRPPVPWTGGLD
jgi:hypothetical protein